MPTTRTRWRGTVAVLAGAAIAAVVCGLAVAGAVADTDAEEVVAGLPPASGWSDEPAELSGWSDLDGVDLPADGAKALFAEPLFAEGEVTSEPPPTASGRGVVISLPDGVDLESLIEAGAVVESATVAEPAAPAPAPQPAPAPEASPAPQPKAADRAATADLVPVEVDTAEVPDSPAPDSSVGSEVVLVPKPYDPWLPVRMCESTNTYAINTGNGFYGAYQFTISTWNWVAGLLGRDDLVGVRPDLASPADQDRMAQALAFEVRGGGLGHWPVCGKYYGT